MRSLPPRERTRKRASHWRHATSRLLMLSTFLVCTEFPVISAMALSLVKTADSVRGGGANMRRWFVRLLSATSPRSPLTATSALILSGVRPVASARALTNRDSPTPSSTPW
uniref:Putative secreted protein n=1 Tax=Ixodes ricinus TaxID=34613 RepID=A0A6B0UJA3_IXORI